MTSKDRKKAADEAATSSEAGESKDGASKDAQAKQSKTKDGTTKPAGGKGSTTKSSKTTRRRGDRPQPLPGMNPVWWAPVMVGLMVVGLLWIVVFYLGSDGTDNTWPVPGIGYGNLAIGFGLIMAGFFMTTRWK